MPVNDQLTDKELVVYLRRGTIHDFQVQAADRLEQQAAEVERLRAALAARPQPLFEGTPVELRRWLRGSYPSTEVNTATSLAVYPVAAGSTTPTGDDRPKYGPGDIMTRARNRSVTQPGYLPRPHPWPKDET